MLTVVPLANTLVQAPVAVSVRTACSARLCTDETPASCVAMAVATLLPFVMMNPEATKVSGLSSAAVAVPDFAVTLPSVTLMVTASAKVSRKANATLPLSAAA